MILAAVLVAIGNSRGPMWWVNTDAFERPARLDQYGGESMATKNTASHPHVGDWIETRGVHGQQARRGEIVELIGTGEHERYRVRWDETHESIVYPADGVVISRPGRTRAGAPPS
jgi:FtsP/CotA-like multicopper oxidase with cupredoxin domain